MNCRRTIIGLVAIFCLVTCINIRAQTPSEYQIKAAFIYNFLQFVEWPPEALPETNSPVIVTILGDDPFGRALDTVFANKLIAGHPVKVDRIKNFGPNHPCHVLFVSNSERDRVTQILAMIGDRSIFSISDIEGFANRGGILDFVTEQKKFRFEINVAATKRARLQVSSKLLRLARIVGKKGT